MRLGVLPANDPVTDGFRCEAGSTGDATDKWILLLLGRDRGGRVKKRIFTDFLVVFN